MFKIENIEFLSEIKTNFTIFNSTKNQNFSRQLHEINQIDFFNIFYGIFCL